MEDKYFTGSTYCGRCGREFNGGGPGKPFCDSCLGEMRSQNAFPQNNEPEKTAVEPKQDDVGSSGFRTV